MWDSLPCFSEELSAAFFPGATETWAPHPLAAYPELAAPTAALHHHAALIQHPALAQVPVRVSCHFLYLLPHTCKTLGHNSHHGNTLPHGCVQGTTGFGVCESHRAMFTSSPQILWSPINAKLSFVWSHFFCCVYIKYM